MKLGMIGLDTSHVEAFAKVFNDPAYPGYIPGMAIAKAFPGGSAAFSLSVGRLDKFTAEVKGCGIEIVGSIQDLAGLDGYLLESVDGRQHLEQFRQLAAFGKPVFIDKPLACSYADAKAIYDLSRSSGAPIFTASGIRFAAGVVGLCPADEKPVSVEAFGPMHLLPDYRDYFWYGIHTADTLYAYLGQGCRTVEAISRGDIELLVGTWQDGRTGICAGNRAGGYQFGARVLTDKAQHVSTLDPAEHYLKRLSHDMAAFFGGGAASIPPEESLEVIAFLEAASRSRAAGGKPIALTEFMG